MGAALHGLPCLCKFLSRGTNNFLQNQLFKDDEEIMHNEEIVSPSRGKSRLGVIIMIMTPSRAKIRQAYCP